MSSLWSRSGTIERYADDIRAAGAQAFFFNGGTTTPLSVFRDSDGASAYPIPVVADANGRWPDVFIPYITSYDVQVKTSDGVQLTFSQKIPNPDPVQLSVTVDPNNIVQTGMIHFEMVNTTKSGYVRLNGRTVGNASSGGSERANADTSALFTYLWNNLSNIIAPVSPGRGASAAADFAANKTITLPNFQGATPIGLDDMGATPGNFFSGLSFGAGNSITSGSQTGANGLALAAANLPAHNHTGTSSSDGSHTHSGVTGNQNAAHTHPFSGSLNGGTTVDGNHTHSINSGFIGGAGTGNFVPGSSSAPATAQTITIADAGSHSHILTGTADGTTGNNTQNHQHSISADGLHAHTFTTSSVGSSAPFNNLPRTVLGSWFIKL